MNVYVRRLLSENEQLRTASAQLAETVERLANLYVSSHQLHGTLKRDAILAALQEIVVNLIGSEEFAICEISGEQLSVAAAVGIDPSAISWATPHVREAVETRTLYVGTAERDSHEPLVCLPLLVDGERVGVIVILRLLAHKAQLEPLDHELFDLLATHAAMALYCSSLQQRMQEGALA